jgi:nitroreductase
MWRGGRETLAVVSAVMALACCGQRSEGEVFEREAFGTGVCGWSGQISSTFISDPPDGVRRAIQLAREPHDGSPEADDETFRLAVNLTLVARDLELIDGLPVTDEDLLAFMDAVRQLERACGY